MSNTRSEVPGLRAWIALCLLSTVVLAPNLLLLFRARDTLFAVHVLLQAVLLWSLVVALVGRWRWLLLVSVPFLLLLPLEMFFIATYGYPSSRTLITIVADTNRAEFLQYMQGLWGLLIGSLLSLLTVWVLLWWLGGQARWGNRALRFTGLAGLVAVTIGHSWLGSVPGMPLPVRQYTWANAYPVGLSHRVAGYWRDQQKSSQARSAINAFSWGAQTKVEAMTVVYVIGESARPDHWSGAGYSRETSPRLAARGDVVFLNDVVTPWALTHYSVPGLLKRKQGNDGRVLPEKSLIAAFREAGYATWWFANQDGLHEVSLAAADAERRKGYNFASGRGDEDAQHDGAMLPDIRQALTSVSARKLLVVHTKGSHWDYHLRYPAEFAHFTPDRVVERSGKYDPANRQALVNAYDNSIRYTDYVLAEIIAVLEDLGGPAALVYVSDHGQGLYENGCTLFGHGNDLEAAFRTAALVWVSKDWALAHKAEADTLRNQAARPMTTALTFFNTVADLGGISITDPRRSLLQPGFTSDPRWVNTSGGTLDFDHASRAGACRLLTAPGG